MRSLSHFQLALLQIGKPSPKFMRKGKGYRRNVWASPNSSDEITPNVVTIRGGVFGSDESMKMEPSGYQATLGSDSLVEIRAVFSTSLGC